MENHVDQLILERELRRCPTPSATRLLIVMTMLMTTTLIVANLCATKIWGPSWLPIDGGLLLFPLSYVLGDLLVEIYGRRVADRVAWVGCDVGLLTIVIIRLVGLLPEYPGADNAGFSVIAGTTGRIFFASIVGFWASQMLNNYVFERVRQKQRKRKTDSFGWRAFISSALAHIPDILLFEPIAFWGRLSLQEFIVQAIFAYVAAITIEALLLLFVTKPLARLLVCRLKFQHGKRIQ